MSGNDGQMCGGVGGGWLRERERERRTRGKTERKLGGGGKRIKHFPSLTQSSGDRSLLAGKSRKQATERGEVCAAVQGGPSALSVSLSQAGSVTARRIW